MRAAVIAIAGPSAEDNARGLARALDAAGFIVTAAEVLDADEATVEVRLRHHIGEGVAVIVTAGGIGIAPGEVTPQATEAVADRLVPGLAELIRAKAGERDPHAALTRPMAVVAGHTLLVNLPGDPRSALSAFGAIEPLVVVAVAELQGEDAAGA